MGSTVFEVRDKAVCIIETRMASARPPGNVLKDIGGKNSLEHIINRIKSLGNISEICLATTTGTEDQVIIELAKSLGVKHYIGSELDALSRVLGAAETL